MKRIKMFFVAASLLLVTAAVFAGKSKFADPSNVWAYNSFVGAFELTGAPTSGTFSTSPQGTHQAEMIPSASSATYLLYQIVGGVYTKVYTVGF